VPKAPAATIPLVQKSFALSHARASELADVLGKAIAAQVQGQAAPAQAQAQATPQVTVVAEPRTNTLIVTGSADQIALAERLIPTLDRPVQQVQLQIRVQAVSGEVIRNLGIKWETVSGGNLIASFLSTGLNLIFDATRSLASLNIRAVLDALEKQQLSRRLSDANVLVEDNYGADTSDLRATGAKGAEIKVGGRLLIPITIGDQVSVREFDYGLLVRVRPQISTDGNILLEVFTQTGGDPADGPAGSIRIPQQSTLSKLRIRDGQTVVLGGLIQKVTDTSETKVPLLGDIPLLGELFKQRTSSIKDDELIVIITGNIVKDTAQR
jgi:general secretion pathway protein D/type IV pilus assembly protein PilQ